MKIKMYLSLLLFVVVSQLTYSNDIVIHHSGSNGHDHVYFEPPTVTYDDNLNELHVYFGSTSTINIEYTDPTGTPYYFVYGENHAGYTATTYYSLPEID